MVLLHRAVKEGEMSLAQANKEKARSSFRPVSRATNQYQLLPERWAI